MTTNVLKQVSKRSVATVAFVSCLLCLLTSSIAQSVPLEHRQTSMNVAGLLNCALCILVLAKFFGFV